MNEGLKKREAEPPKVKLKNETPIEDLGKDCCPTCTVSERFRIPGPAGMVLMQPFWTCTDPQSPHYGQWMSPIGTCSEYDFSQEKLDAVNAPKEPMPRIVRAPAGAGVRNRIIDGKSKKKSRLIH